MDTSKLEEEVSEGRIRKIHHPSLPMSIFNYTELTQYSKSFNDINSLCRGLVIDDFGKIIARPFPKFFNIEELGEASKDFSDDQIDQIWTKEDGSLIILFWANNKWFSITRGSWESKQALLAPSLLCKKFFDFANKSKTYLLELVGPSNINVTRGYADDQLILLGVIDTASAEEMSSSELIETASLLGLTPPTLWNKEDFSIENIKQNQNHNFEGVVLVNKKGNRCKVKTKTYIELHKLVSNFSDLSVLKLWNNRTGNPLYLEGIPDEFFAEINEKINKIEEEWQAYKAKVEGETFKAKNLFSSGMSRKDISISFPELRHVLTCALSDKNSEDIAYKEFCKNKGI
jgi:RNA ligase